MLFVELTPFAAFRERHWTDEELAASQGYLLASPDAGSLIPGGGGLRKVRWFALGRGKRGGARVIYYRHIGTDRIYLIHGYTKNRRDDLTKSQLDVIRRLMRDVLDG